MRSVWFRLHSEFAQNSKMAIFNKSQKYDVLCLMCLAVEQERRGSCSLTDAEIADALRVDDADAEQLIELMRRAEILLREDDGTLSFPGWGTESTSAGTEVPKESTIRKRKQRGVLDPNKPAADDAQRRVTLPTEVECSAYFDQMGHPYLANAFWDYWQSVGWRRQGGPMVDWKASVRTWIAKEREIQMERGWKDAKTIKQRVAATGAAIADLPDLPGRKK